LGEDKGAKPAGPVTLLFGSSASSDELIVESDSLRIGFAITGRDGVRAIPVGLAATDFTAMGGAGLGRPRLNLGGNLGDFVAVVCTQS
jgi:lipid-binding SYLF domain-containing protein